MTDSAIGTHKLGISPTRPWKMRLLLPWSTHFVEFFLRIDVDETREISVYGFKSTLPVSQHLRRDLSADIELVLM